MTMDLGTNEYILGGMIGNRGAKRETDYIVDDWVAYARKLEAQVKKFSAIEHAVLALNNAMIEELNGEKPRRLSLPENRAARVEFRAKQERLKLEEFERHR